MITSRALCNKVLEHLASDDIAMGNIGLRAGNGVSESTHITLSKMSRRKLSLRRLSTAHIRLRVNGLKFRQGGTLATANYSLRFRVWVSGLGLGSIAIGLPHRDELRRVYGLGFLRLPCASKCCAFVLINPFYGLSWCGRAVLWKTSNGICILRPAPSNISEDVRRAALMNLMRPVCAGKTVHDGLDRYALL